jgi:predicted nucleotide-binding protein
MLLIVLFCEAWMDKQEIIERLNELRDRLDGDVAAAFQVNANEGEYRLKAWIQMFKLFAAKNLPNELNETGKFISEDGYISLAHWETAYPVYKRKSGDKIHAYLKSLIRQIADDEYEFTPIHKKVKQVEVTPKAISKNVFLVHGHNKEVKHETARFIQKLGFEPIILDEQASGGSTTIIEKIEEYSDTTDFAIVLYTADDLGETKALAEIGTLQARARQNVVFEHGLLIGKLTRKNVVPLVAEGIEIPNDISGVVYIRDDWKTKIALEMKKAGYDVDMNKLY